MVDIITNQDESGESDNKVTITEIIALLMKSSNHVNISAYVCLCSSRTLLRKMG